MNALPKSHLPAKRVGVWIRVSTEDQAQGDSPEHHRIRAEHYCQAMGWQIVETYDLAGVSGKEVLGHPEAKRMLADVKRGHVKSVVFTKLARLTRNAKELMELSEYFRQNDADLVSLQENIDTSTPSGRLFYNIVSVMAQWEREEIADRVRSSIPIRAKLGKPINGKAPYGYEWKDKQLVVQPDEAPIRKLIHELFLEHKRLKTVARILNERGYRSRNGKEWSDMTIRFQILDPTAKGVYRRNYTRNNGKGKPWTIKPEAEHIFNAAPPIISEELWDGCHALLEGRRITRKAPMKKPAHLFAGFVHCGCEGPMYVPSNSPKYTCKSCRNKIPCSDLEDIFLDEVTGFLVNPDHIRTYLSKASEAVTEKERLLEAHKKEIAKLRADADKLVDLYTAGGFTIEQFKERHEPIDERKRQLNGELPRLEAQIDLLKMESVTSDDMMREASDIGTRWKDMNGDEKRRIVELMLTSIEIGKGEMKINLVQLPSYQETANWQDMAKSTWAPSAPPLSLTLRARLKPSFQR
ncbi:site-specific DNA recombinase [Prosthecobacter fusiformis]|uniref:Site-specific DNA recombinase n=1 Tax=Prosthecobacter fusiformis TaxID=48464 RepID=A0A4R7SRK9_9BACT|nr:recombinase family protein [Prosthecobacter fusiformis]TDU80807.1 site-specific DNA recombinase [Prosthecobacter fusiformis]